MNFLRFNLNGTWVEEGHVSPTTTLLRYLRDRKHLTGTKEGCAEGDCGACTVAVAEREPDGTMQWRAVNGCLLFLPMLQGKHVVTVEALKSADAYHPAQVAMARALGSQCGYCTPGIVMTMFEATYRSDLDAAWKLDDQLAGNLCRCTGYRPIREAAQAVAGSCPSDGFSAALAQAHPEPMALQLETRTQRWVTPGTFAQLWDELDAHPDARFVNGGTDLALEVTKRFKVLPRLVLLEGLDALCTTSQTADGFRIGAGVTLSELERFSADRLPSLHRMLRYFGARQVKHRGTVGGNLCSASPIGDLAPVFLSLGATAVIASRAGERRVPLDTFFTGYRQTVLQPKEILAAVELPRLPPTARAIAYKVSKRRELDISTTSAAFVVEVDAHGVVTTARLAYGGMAATPRRATFTEAALLGRPWSRDAVTAAAANLARDFQPMSDHRGSATYRSLVARNLLLGFFLETREVHQPALQPHHAATVQAPEVRHG